MLFVQGERRKCESSVAALPGSYGVMEFSAQFISYCLGYAEINQRVISLLVYFQASKRNCAWEAAPLAVCWVIWRERNRRVFENEERSISSLKNFLLGTSFFWCTETVELSNSSLNSYADFVNSLALD